MLLSRKHRRERTTFCTRFASVINIKHVACQWRGTAFSRGRPPPAQPRLRIHCRWRVTPSLAFSPVVTEHTHNSASAALDGTNFVFGLPRKSVKCEHWAPFGTPEHRHVSEFRPCCMCTNTPARKKKTTFAQLARTSPRGLYFQEYLEFVRFSCGI